MGSDDRARIDLIPERFAAKLAAVFIAGIAQNFDNFTRIRIRLRNVPRAFIAYQCIQIIIFMLRLSALADRKVFHDSSPDRSQRQINTTNNSLLKSRVYTDQVWSERGQLGRARGNRAVGS